MKQKSSQMRFAPWPVVQAALALALSGLLLARPQAAAQGFAAGLKLCGGSLLPALFPLFVVCGLLGPLAPALGWPPAAGSARRALAGGTLLSGG